VSLVQLSRGQHVTGAESDICSCLVAVAGDRESLVG